MSTRLSRAFTRPDQRLKHETHESPVLPDSAPDDVEVFFELFQNCFQGHVEPHLSAKGHRLIPTSDDAKKRGVQNDLLTAFFQLNIYSPSELSASASSSPVDLARKKVNSYFDFRTKVTASPVSDDFELTGNPGTNRLNFLSGTIGCGKSLLLAKLTTDMFNTSTDALSSDDEHCEAVVPIYIDFELLLDKVSDRFPDIKDTFTQTVYETTTRQLARFESLRPLIKPPPPGLPLESHYRDLCKRLLTNGTRRVRLLVILDNVDRYHFYYTKFCLFDSYRAAQIDSIRRNIDRILTILCENEFLGDCALCVVLACRPETLHAFTHHSSVLHTNTNRMRDLGVFHLQRSEHWPLVESRLSLLEAAIACFQQSKPTRYREYQSYLEIMRSVLSRSCAPEDPRHWRNSLRLISDFAHQGPRSFLSFLSDLKIDWRRQAEVVERIFGASSLSQHQNNIDPHNLLRLYITNNRQRYAQACGHFPNLFLVDATYAYDASFPESRIEHGHTYWLKYLLLKYIVSKTSDQDAVVTLNDILRDFASSYPEALIRLVLGSLASTETSGCLEVIESTNINVTRLSVTRRGAALYKLRDEQEWCLSWDYLQFVIDDYQMAYPTLIWDKVYPKNAGLGYLLRPSGVYAAELAQDVSAKARGCVHFLYLLDLAKKAELAHRLKENKVASSLLPDIDAAFSAFMSEMSNVLAHVRGGESLYEELTEIRVALKDNQVLFDTFLEYGDDDRFIMEAA